MSIIKGKFVSEWDYGIVVTSASLDTETGEVTTEPVEAEDGVLEREYFEDQDTEYEVCPICHEYIMKTEMNEGVGKHLHEEKVCSNPDCEYRSY